MKYAELAQQQAQLLIALMAQGKPFLPFLKPGDPRTVNNLPYNPTTGKAYRGGNRVMLWIAAMLNGWEDNRWVTFKQAQALGAFVKKGSKSIQLRYTIYPDANARPTPSSDHANAPAALPDNDKVKTFYFNVFNAAQVEGLPPPPLRPETTPAQRIERCEALLKAAGVPIVYGAAQPHYSVRTDQIGLPYPERFVSPEAFYSTALHELAHATGHSSRLDRDLSGAFGSESYAREEVIAETASHIMGVELGIGHDPSQHAAYIHHWINIAKEDPNFLYTAASAAEKVCDFVGLERFQFEPLLDEPEVEIDPRPVEVPALEQVSVSPMTRVRGMDMA